MINFFYKFTEDADLAGEEKVVKIIRTAVKGLTERF